MYLDPKQDQALAKGPFAWTDLTWLLNQYGVSWAYYTAKGSTSLELDRGATPIIWNPLPHFTDVSEDGQLANIRDSSYFVTDALNGTLPAVSWVVPTQKDSEHTHTYNPPGLVTDGQAWVTKLVNAAMQGPDWQSTAIFIAWDDWGAYYDHVVPPKVDGYGLGIRVPALLVSPYARHGYIDHTVYSWDSYLKFIEDRFLNSQRLDPATDGRPDPRPTVREALPGIGDLQNAFDFNQAPQQPLILPERPNSPTAVVGGPYTVTEGGSLTLDASGSSDPRGLPVTYSWDVNGNHVFGDASGVNPTLTWDQLHALGLKTGHKYFVRVRVSEGGDWYTDSVATTLTVKAPGNSPVLARTAALAAAPSLDDAAAYPWGDTNVSDEQFYSSVIDIDDSEMPTDQQVQDDPAPGSLVRQALESMKDTGEQLLALRALDQLFVPAAEPGQPQSSRIPQRFELPTPDDPAGAGKGRVGAPTAERHRSGASTPRHAGGLGAFPPTLLVAVERFEADSLAGTGVFAPHPAGSSRAHPGLSPVQRVRPDETSARPSLPTESGRAWAVATSQLFEHKSLAAGTGLPFCEVVWWWLQSIAPPSGRQWAGARPRGAARGA
jgi:hypothetical protein